MRRNTALLTIKPVGSMKSFFDDDEYIIDASSSIDVIFYIQSMHPRLGLFMKQAQVFETFEDFCFLDGEGKQVDNKTLSFHKFKDNDTVNLERGMKLGDRLDGHIVQGHVDQTGKCTSIKKENGSWIFSFEYDKFLSTT